MRHQRRLARAEEAAQDGDGQWSLAGLLHGRGRGLDGFEKVRVLTFLFLMRVIRVVRVGVAMRRHFSQFNARRRRVRRRRLCSAGVLSLETAAALWILSA